MDFNKINFTKRNTIEQVEEGDVVCPKFDEKGLIAVITVEKETKEILMFSYVNEEGFKRSIISKKAHYFSRSRNKVWLKGEVSGMFHNIHNIFIDDDQDSIIYEVSLEKPKHGGKEASCHVGYKSCFYRKLNVDNNSLSLEFIENKKSFDPKIVYKGIPNPTKI